MGKKNLNYGKMILFGMLGISLLFCGRQKVFAAFTIETDGGSASNNIHKQDYSYNYGTTVKSYLFENADGTFTRVEYVEDKIIAETYSADFKLISSKSIDMELSLFGGVYATDSAYYVVEGQNNPNEDDTLPVYRIIKYSKTWEKQASSQLCGANTYIPFDAGSCRMTADTNYLYIRTAHEMYASSDGYHHQASVYIKVSLSDCSIVQSFYNVMNDEYSYVSHSFNQFIKVENGNLYACDHGDAYPRSIVILKHSSPSSLYTTPVDALSFHGTIGANYTGAMLGGFEVSGSNLLVAGTSMNQDGSVTSSKTKNVFISSVATQGYSSSSQATVRWITSYEENDGYSASNPKLVEITNDKYLLIWEVDTEYSIYYGKPTGELNYAFIDGTGSLTSAIFSIRGSLSDCQPVVKDDKVIWYTTGNASPVFYQLPTNGAVIERPEVGTTSTQEGICYEIISSQDLKMEAKIVDCIDNLPTTVTIPTSINIDGYEYAVTEIGTEAFKDASKLEDITIPTGISVIGDNVFSGCNSLYRIINNSTCSIALPSDLSRAEYKFLGWRDSSFNMLTEVAAGTTVYACYTSTKYAVTFESNGGTAVETQNVFYQDCALEPLIPTKENYTFLGWYTSSSLVYKFDFSTQITYNRTLYAKWEVNEDNNNAGDSTVDNNDKTDNDDKVDNTLDNNEVTGIPVGETVVLNGKKYKSTSQTEVTYVGITNKKIIKLTIPSTIVINYQKYKMTSISANAFKNCKKLKSVTIGDNVRLIGKNAFYGCKNLKTITFKGKAVPTLGKSSFKNIKKNATFYIPKKVSSKQNKEYKKKLSSKVGYKKNTMKIKLK